MGLFCNDTALDKALTWISTTGSKILVCTSHQPTSKAEATSTGNWFCFSTHLDFGAIAASTLSGRKLPVSKTSDCTVHATSAVASSHVARHIAIISGTTLVYVTQCSTRSLSTSDTVEIPEFYIHLLDPTSSTDA